METTVSTYLAMWNSAMVKNPEAVKNYSNKILVNRPRYEKVVEGTIIPWQLIGVCHYRESSLSFTCHPHNGDPLSGRTTHVPAGRPKIGNPPFTWEESAKDAFITLKGWDKIELWPIETILLKLEEFNGLGYKKFHPGVKSPYLWSYTQFYQRGKYASDGHFDPDLVDKQIGCVALLKLIIFK